MPVSLGGVRGEENNYGMNMIKFFKKKFRVARKKYIENKVDFLFSWSRNAAAFFYYLISPSFGREQLAVLKGRIKHVNDYNKNEANIYLLVRNTHRLEKGLTMQPLKKVFAKAYIGETVKAFQHCLDHLDNHSEGNNRNQVKWSYDVLHKYFDTVSDDKVLTKEKQNFDRIIKGSKDKLNGNTSYGKKIPYSRESVKLSPIDYESFYLLCKQRRSIRWFSQRKVDRNLIDKIIEAAKLAPSACNRQPFEFYVFDDPELVNRVAKIPMGTRGYYHNIPVFIVVVGRLDAYFDERDRHLIYIDGALASMSFMFAAETLGLSTCPINWPDIEERERKMEEILGLKPYQRPVMCMALGYAEPSGFIAYSEKRNLNSIRNYNLQK